MGSELPAQALECHDKQAFHHAAFAPSVTLRPEHYRAVTPFRGEEPGSATSTSTSGSGGGGDTSASAATAVGGGSSKNSTAGSYQYPAVPLTFGERKRLSDTLFYLSKEIPNMTADVAAVLRRARERDDWDQAVAELLTQVVVGLYCGEGDSQLDGLQQYLLSLGVSC